MDRITATDCSVIFCVFLYHLANNQAINRLLPLPLAYFFILLLFFSFSTLSLTNVYHTGIQYTRNAKVSFYIKLSLKRYWWGPKAENVAERGATATTTRIISLNGITPPETTTTKNNSNKNHTSNNNKNSTLHSDGQQQHPFLPSH